MTYFDIDYDGVTSISLGRLKEIYQSGRHLDHVEILHSVSIEEEAKMLLQGKIFDPMNIMCKFVFDDCDPDYVASGFSIGYGGSGPNGLRDAIRMWYPDSLGQSVWDTDIPHMSASKSYKWTPKEGFQEIMYEENAS